MADPRAATPETFDATKGYITVLHMGGCDSLPQDHIEQQRMQQHHDRMILDRFLKEGVVGEHGGHVGAAAPGIAVGEDTLIADTSGLYTGLETIIYRLKIVRGGAPGTAQFDYATSGPDPSDGPVTITAFGVWHTLGHFGARVKFIDGPTLSPDGVLVEHDTWDVPCYFEDQLPTAVTNEDGSGTISLLSASAYINGRIVTVPAADLSVASPMPALSKTTIYIEAITKTVTWDDDSTLRIPRTGGPAARREKLILSFVDHDTTGEALPTRCTRRTVRPAYVWDRDPASATYNAVSRVHENWVKLDLARLDGMLPADRITLPNLSDQLMGFVAGRMEDQSGNFLADETQLRSKPMHDQDTAGYAAVMTQKGRAYVAGIPFEKDRSETILIPIAAETNTVQNEENRIYAGRKAYLLQKGAGMLGFPVKSISTLTAPSIVLEQVDSGTGDTHALAYTPIAQVLGVSKGTPAVVVGKAAMFVFTPETNVFEITASDWDGGALAEQSITFAVGEFTVSQVIEALNQCSGPAYMSGRANRNLYYYESSGKLVVRTFGTSISHSITIEDGTANAALGMDSPSSITSPGTGTQYTGGVDYTTEGAGGGIRWLTLSRPAFPYQAVYTRTKTMVAGTDYVLGGEIAAGTHGWCVSAVRKIGTGVDAVFVESYPSPVASIEAEGGEIVELSWPEMDDIEYYRVYRGPADSYNGMKLIACVASTGAAEASWIDTGYYDRTKSDIDPKVGAGTPSLTGPTLMTPVTLTVWPAGGVNYDVGYRFVKDGADIVSNRPFDYGEDPGTNFTTDYEYYQPRWTLRCLSQTGVVTDVHGIPEDEPKVPPAPAHSLPLAKIYCPANSQDVTVTNYGIKAYHMDAIGSIAAQVENLRYNAAQLEIANQALEGEASTLRAVYAEAFTSTRQGNWTHPDFDAGVDPVMHCLRLPMEVTSVPLTVRVVDCDGTTEDDVLPTGCRKGKSLVLMGYTEEREIDQDLFSDEIPVNPYEHFDEQSRPDAWILLSPARDYWVETTQIEAEGFIQEYYHINIINHTTDKVTAAEVAAALASGASPMGMWDEIRNELDFLRKDSAQYCRSIDVEILGQQFKSAAEVVCTFGGVAVPLTPLVPYAAGARAGSVKTNAYGQFRARFTIPSSIGLGQVRIPTGSIAVKCTAYSTTEPNVGEVTDEADSTFVSEGIINVFEEREIHARYYVDPITQQIRFLTPGYLTRMDVPLAAKDAALPITFQIRRCDNQGNPTDSVAWVESKAPQQVNVGIGSENSITPDDPLRMDPVEMSALTLMSPSSKGYQAYVAVGGQKNLAPGEKYGAVISENPYLPGDLMTSSTNWTWLVHPDRDLRFRAWRAKFNADSGHSETLVFEPITWTGHTQIGGMMLVVGQEVPTGTDIRWEYHTDTNTVWKPIIPLRYFTLKNETCAMIYLRAILSTTNDRLSPAIAKGNWALVLTENKLATCWITNTTDLIAEVDTVRVSLEEINPAGTGETADGEITGTEIGPFAVNDLTLNIEVDGSPVSPITFTGIDPIAAATIVSQINAGAKSDIASVVNGRIRLASGTSIRVNSGTANAAFGLREGIYIGHSTRQHDVMLSPDGGHTWMSPASRESSRGPAGFDLVTYVFGGESDFNLLSCTIRIKQKTKDKYRYRVPLARKLAITMV